MEFAMLSVASEAVSSRSFWVSVPPPPLPPVPEVMRLRLPRYVCTDGVYRAIRAQGWLAGWTS